MFQPDRIGAQFPSPVGHLPNRFGPVRGIRSPDMEHLQAPAVKAHLVQNLFGVGDPFFGS